VLIPQEQLYAKVGDVYCLASLPDHIQKEMTALLEREAEAIVRLKLSSGQEFSLPIAIRTMQKLQPFLKAMYPTSRLRLLKRVYRFFKPLLARLRILTRLQRFMIEHDVERNVGSGLTLSLKTFYATDDRLFRSVGADLLTYDTVIGAPKNIGLALSNRCDLECGMCPYHSPTEKAMHASDYFKEGRYISPEDLKRVLDYAERTDASVNLGQMDEPLITLLAPRYWKVVKNTTAKMALTTNGTLLKEEKDFKRIAALKGLSAVSVSIDAASNESYRKIRGGEFQSLKRNLEAFFAYMKARRPEVQRRVCFVVQPDNRGEEKAFLKMWKDHVHIVSLYQLTQYDDRTNVVFFNENYTKGEQRMPCSAIFNTIYIMPGMEVLPCCLFMYVTPYRGMSPIGRFTEELWGSPTYHNFRATVTDEQFHPVCQTCSIWKQGSDRWEVEDGMKVSANPYERHYYVG